jgi:integrase
MATITKLDADGRPIPKGSTIRAERYRARWRTPSGASRSRTFPRKIDAEQHLTTVEGSKLSGGYVDHTAGAVTLDAFTSRWLEVRRTSSGQPLRPKTVALYRHLYGRHIAPTFGLVRIRDIAPTDVREWHGRLVGETVPAKAYRLLRAVLNTAVDDGLIVRNPCRISGAGVERSPERPVPTGDEVWALADAIGERWRTLVLTSAFAGLRWGELMGLQRADIDLDAATIRVERQVLEVGSEQIEGPPKTEAGRRTVALPMVLVPELRAHLEQFVGPEPTARVFIGPKGATPRSTNFGAIWRRVRVEVGRDDLHFHDLRHFANTLAAAAGASTKELMLRLGHASPAAALRYQHATQDRDRAIADRMDAMIDTATRAPRAVEG